MKQHRLIWKLECMNETEVMMSTTMEWRLNWRERVRRPGSRADGYDWWLCQFARINLCVDDCILQYSVSVERECLCEFSKYMKKFYKENILLSAALSNSIRTNMRRANFRGIFQLVSPQIALRSTKYNSFWLQRKDES